MIFFNRMLSFPNLAQKELFLLDYMVTSPMKLGLVSTVSQRYKTITETPEDLSEDPLNFKIQNLSTERYVTNISIIALENN
jgi:hypothetical protein